jgi:hypothetical protein
MAANSNQVLGRILGIRERKELEGTYNFCSS